jgi:hypothetical protein
VSFVTAREQRAGGWERKEEDQEETVSTLFVTEMKML